ncbi:MAG: PAS domain S-box protein [Bacteroidota bacterium]|nr:PAS domain S-box protein [Bacteroidota bacterium]
MMPSSVYESFFHTSPQALIIATPEGGIMQANQAACDLFGYTEAALQNLGSNYILESDEQSIRQLLNGGAPGRSVEVGATGIKMNGERFQVKIVSSASRAQDGRELACLMLSPVPDRQSQEQKLKDLLEDTKQLHQKEEDSRRLLESAVNSVTDGFFIADKHWTIVFFNKAAEQILQRNERDIIGKNFWTTFPDMEILKEGVDYDTLVTKNKAIRFREFFPQYKIWADISVYPSEKNFFVYIKDVTEVRTLRILEKLEREVLEMNARPDSVLEDTLCFYLKQVEELHSGMICSVLRLAGNRLYNWASPSLPEAYYKAINGVQIGENTGSCGTAAYIREKVVVTDIATDPRWANYRELADMAGVKSCWSFPIIDSHNQVVGTFAIYYRKVKSPTKEEEDTLNRVKNLLTVIIENHLSVEAVKLSNRNYDMVARATNDAIWDWDLETGNVLRSGQGLEIFFGYDLKEAASEEDFWNKRVHPDDLQSLLDDQAKILADPSQLYWEDEYRFMKKDGQYAYVFDRGYIIRDENGIATRVLGATRDITERKKSEALLLELNTRLKQRADELAASNVELERFAYIASHDMQEPLRMITSFLQLFKKKYEDQIDETAEQYIHFAMDGADRMKKLIMDLLEYSRVGSNKDNFSEVDTNVLLKEVVNVFMGRIDEMKATVVVGDLPSVTANRIQIFQLFQNLLGNALKYHSGQSPLIEINGKEEATHYLFSVKDNGIGIKPIFFEKIFVLFQRLHHKNEYSGTGIGLSICKKIVERHGGKIWVESEPGKGSCFYFTISKSAADYR